MTGMRESPFCRLLKETELEAIFDAMSFYSFEEGEIVIRQGWPGRYFFVVATGRLEIAVNGKAINTLVPGASFGATALLYDCPRTASVIATELTGLWGADGDVFRSVLREHGERQYDENRRFIDCMGIFEGLSQKQKELIGELTLVSEIFVKGSHVIKRGGVPDALYIVKRGELSVMTGGDVDSSGQLVGATQASTLFVGDSFGGDAVLYGEPHRSTVVADKECEVVCIGLAALSRVVGDDIVAFLERSFMHSKVLKELPFVAHLSSPQRHRFLDAMEFVTYGPNQFIVANIRLLAVIDGSVHGFDGTSRVTLRRGHLRQDEAILGLSMSTGGKREGASTIPPRMQAGERGARLGVLTAVSLLQAFNSLGLNCTGARKSEVECMRLTLIAQKVPIFKELSGEQLDKLVGALVVRRYKMGAKILKQGEPASNFFVLTEGQAHVTRDGSFLRALEAGTCLGERALIFDEPRSATVEITSSEAELWSIDKETFKMIVTKSMREEMAYRISLQDTGMTLKNLWHVRVISAGRFSSVRMVVDQHTGLKYALKRVKKRKGQTPKEVTTECSLLAEIHQCKNPFLLRMVRTFETKTSNYMLTELITGGRVSDLIKRFGKFTESQTQFYVASAVLALEALHKSNIVHRDMSPDNFMLDSSGYFKIVDLHLAKRLDMNTLRAFTLVGTPSYMAPEVILGRGYGTEVDIWSLGVFCYELIFGRVPFGAGLDDGGQILAAVLEQPLEIPQGSVHEPLRQLLTGMLRRERFNRIGSGMQGWQEIKSSFFFLAATGGDIFELIAAREFAAPLAVLQMDFPEEEEFAEKATLSDMDELGGNGMREDQLKKMKALEALFKKFDTNGDGTISRNELQWVLKRCMRQVSEAELDATMDAMDTNRNGEVDYQEFIMWLYSTQSTKFRENMHIDIYGV